jgi:cobalt/nickel transport system permease protein
MHIPDGYLSPSTCATFYAASTPFWLTAARRVRRTVKNRNVPLLAISAAYCFLVMMFNVPIPDGTTAHAVGAVLVAVLIGPWAAVIAVSVALATQALFFGDGGVLAFGANCFTMAIVMPFVGYAVYRVLTRHVALAAPRRAIAAGVGAYVGLNTAALCAAIILGLQPTLFHRADGTPLYAPFHLAQSVPAMMLAHLLVAGVVELVLTAGVVAYLQRANLPLLRINPDNTRGERELADAEGDEPDAVAPEPVHFRWRLGVAALAVMAVLTPLGLLAPGSAFGESAPADLDLKKYHLSAVPDGLARYAGFWHNALFKGYDFRHDAHPAIGYLVSAAVGLAVIAAVVFAVLGVVRALDGRGHRDPASPVRT